MSDPLELLAAAVALRVDAGDVATERWTLASPFVIARGRQTEVDLVVVTLRAGGAIGRGESCPVAHYGETTRGVVAAARDMVAMLRDGAAWRDVHDALPAGAARNAVDCAVWDLASKVARRPLTDILGLPALRKVTTAFTISLAAPDDMAAQAVSARAHRLLKLKLGGRDDIDRVRAVRRAAPDADLIVDVNEHWDIAALRAALPVLRDEGVLMLEQPLPAGADAQLADVERLVPFGADESCHVTGDLDRLDGLYDVINIKLDKTGGLTEALRLSQAARDRGLGAMVGCMLGTSLAMAPAMYVAQACAFVDLDAPLLIGADREPKLLYAGDEISPPEPALWG